MHSSNHYVQSQAAWRRAARYQKERLPEAQTRVGSRLNQGHYCVNSSWYQGEQFCLLLFCLLTLVGYEGCGLH